MGGRRGSRLSLSLSAVDLDSVHSPLILGGLGERAEREELALPVCRLRLILKVETHLHLPRGEGKYKKGLD